MYDRQDLNQRTGMALHHGSLQSRLLLGKLANNIAEAGLGTKRVALIQLISAKIHLKAGKTLA